MLGSLPSKTRIVRVLKGLIISRLLRWRGVLCQGRIVVEGATPRIWSRGYFSIGNRVQFRTTDRKTSISVRNQGRLKIGSRCSINDGVQIDAWKSVEIGPNCRIGNNARICDTNYHEVDEGAGPYVDGISIGRNVWLAANVTVMPGVTIGDHSVVAAGSIVTKSFPERSLIAGVPAKKLREIKASDGYIRPG